jgi:hypothetical protein
VPVSERDLNAAGFSHADARLLVVCRCVRIAWLSCCTGNVAGGVQLRQSVITSGFLSVMLC